MERRSYLVAELQKQEQSERDDLNDDHSNERSTESGAVGAIVGDLLRHRVVGFKGYVKPKAC